MRTNAFLYVNKKNGARFLLRESAVNYGYGVFVESHKGVAMQFDTDIGMGSRDFFEAFKIGAIWAGGKNHSDFVLEIGEAEMWVTPDSRREWCKFFKKMQKVNGEV